jgi:hypothetical protein
MRVIAGTLPLAQILGSGRFHDERPISDNGRSWIAHAPEDVDRVRTRRDVLRNPVKRSCVATELRVEEFDSVGIRLASLTVDVTLDKHYRDDLTAGRRN